MTKEFFDKMYGCDYVKGPICLVRVQSQEAHDELLQLAESLGYTTIVKSSLVSYYKWKDSVRFFIFDYTSNTCSSGDLDTYNINEIKTEIFLGHGHDHLDTLGLARYL